MTDYICYSCTVYARQSPTRILVIMSCTFPDAMDKKYRIFIHCQKNCSLSVPSKGIALCLSNQRFKLLVSFKNTAPVTAQAVVHYRNCFFFQTWNWNALKFCLCFYCIEFSDPLLWSWCWQRFSSPPSLCYEMSNWLTPSQISWRNNSLTRLHSQCLINTAMSCVTSV